MRVIILVNILYCSFISLQKIVVVVLYCSIVVLSLLEKTLLSHLFSSTVFADFYFI